MREARFIKKNVDKWNQYQHEESKDPDEMADRFITLLDDLSYAQIAGRLGKSQQSVRQAFSRAVRRLRASRSEK